MADAGTPDGLWKWIVGGIATGAAVLGLMVAAYAIGYDRGEEHARSAAPTEPAAPQPAVPDTTTTTAAATTETAPTDTGESGAALAARGEGLWGSTGCAGCHSIDRSSGVGPTMKGLAGSTVTLDDGSTVTADDAYLARSITDPDAQISAGFRSGVMSGAVASQKFDTRPDDVAALVAYIQAQR